MADVAGWTLEQAKDPPIRFGTGAAAAGLKDVGTFVLLSQPGPRNVAFSSLPHAPVAEVHVESLELAALEAVEGSLPGADVVVGVGGGMVLDAAKYVAWRRGLPLYLVPTIVSVDAVVTNTIASRQDGRVQYVGFVVARSILVDYDLIRTAPARLNRAGIGDILSIHTGAWDWRLGGKAGKTVWLAEVDQAAQAVLQRVEARAHDIFEVSDAAIETVVTAFRDVNALCLEVGHSQPEEGSEHYFAYRLEDVVGHGFVHGEVIGLGAVLMANLQGNDPDRVVQFLGRCGVEWAPARLGVTRAQLETTLRTLPDFVRQANLPYSVIDERLSDERMVRRLVALAGA